MAKPLSDFISTKSQDFRFVHLSQNIDKAKSIYRAGKNHETELRDHIGLLEALGFIIFKVYVKCPVDLSIESPSGLVQSKDRAEILGATYNEADVDGDGRLDRFIEIPFPENGEYKITVVPKEGANPTDTYTLEIEENGEKTVLKENEPISTIDETPVVVYIGARPIANAGTDQTKEVNADCMASVTLDGSASSDPGENPLTYAWTWDGGSADGISPTVQLPLGTTTVTLVVNNGTEDSAPDEVNVTVVDTTPPGVQLISPILGDALQDGMTLLAEASDFCEVSSVYFYIREANGDTGTPIGLEDLAGTLNDSTGEWEYGFDTYTPQTPDGYYVVLTKSIDANGNVALGTPVPVSIRNWAICEQLPATKKQQGWQNNAG